MRRRPAARVRSCSACRRTCFATGSPPPTRCPGSRSRPIPGLTQMAQLQKLLWSASAPLMVLGGSRWSEAAVAGGPPLRRALRPAGRLLLPPADAVRPRPPELCRRYRHRPQSRARRAAPEGRRAPPRRRADERDGRRRATATSTFPSRGRRWCTSIPAPRNSAASTGRRSPSTPARRPSRRRSRACSRPTPFPGRRRRGRRTRPIAPGRRRSPIPGRCS